MATVDGFYRRVLADELTQPFFAELDLEAQVRKQIAFVARAFGGPDEYTGRNLRVAHSNLVMRGLSDVHFDAVLGHLRATMIELGITSELVDEAAEIVEATRAEVLGR